MDGDRGGAGGEGRKSEGWITHSNPEDWGGHGPPPEQQLWLRQWGPNHCVATSVPHNAVLIAVWSSYKVNVRSIAVEEQLKQKKFWAQLHLHAVDLF